MKITAISDQHGYLPKIDPCDLFLIGGDICPVSDHSDTYQYSWLNEHFRNWLTSIPAKYVVGIAGNHDFAFENSRIINLLNLPWYYLEQSDVTLDGIKIWGSPWTPWFYEWAFNAPQFDEEENFLRDKYKNIPEDTNIILSHGPPYQYGDRTEHSSEHVGSKALVEAIDRVHPQLVVCGHIHEGYGGWKRDQTYIVNASLLDCQYAAVHEPVTYEV